MLAALSVYYIHFLFDTILKTHTLLIEKLIVESEVLMETNLVKIFPLPGTKIDIEDGLDWCGLGIITVSCAGSRDIPAFEKKCVFYYPDAEQEALRSALIPVGVPQDGKLVYATTLFATAQNEGEDFERECLALHLTFESERQGSVTAGLLLSILGKVTPIPEGGCCPYVDPTVH